ncbi:M48 family metallopeptidase [Planococcus shixiaomingii]|uniref:M48 family metallopeptidase n=1 Tax=Planococcus shixiaomingii TaxID=3058393 RepID=UPI00260912FE|nr:M48 family metallopeptidase [Planococcus sp. N022]WKA56622.1 M48 family metallopeptidase [Planococcus sp. N022]
MNKSNIHSSRETVYFTISLIISVLIYVLAAISIIGIAIALTIFVFMLFVNSMMLGSVRGNGVRIHERQFPEVYESVQTLSKEMGLKKVPDVFVIQSEGALNAFATRFFGRDMVVLYSEVFELAREQGQEELNFIIAHELAHVKRRHVWKNLLLLPAGFIPFLNEAYSRSCEYTCDRHAAYTTQNVPAAKRALALLGIGKKMYVEINEDAYREQIATESNPFVWLSEVLSSHPRLPKRIQALEQFGKSDARIYSQDNGKIVLGATLLFGALMAVYFMGVVILTGGAFAYSQFIPTNWEDTLYAEESFQPEGQTPLMSAVYNGDIAAVEEALAEEDIHEKDSEGADALMHAIFAGNPEVVSYLLAEGADANTADNYTTALGTAVMYDDFESALLLVENGADPSQAGPDGVTALDYFGVSSEAEFIEMLRTGGY